MGNSLEIYQWKLQDILIYQNDVEKSNLYLEEVNFTWFFSLQTLKV